MVSQNTTGSVSVAAPAADKSPLAPLLYWFPGADRIPAAWQHRFGPATGIWGRLLGLRRGDGYHERPGQPGPADAGVGCGSGRPAACVSPGSVPAAAPAADTRGILVSVGELPGGVTTETLRYEPSRQTWCQIEPGVWIGLADTATPADFARKRMAAPFVYVLTVRARGHEWYVPVARLASTRCAIPREDRFSLGQWHRVPSPGYEDLAEIAETLYLAETGAGPQPSAEYLRDATIKAIQCNYALTGPELALFGVLTDDSYDVVSAILTDREERQKKTPDSAG